MSESKDVMGVGKGLLEGLIEALGDRHSQLDVNFQHTRITMPGSQIGFELNGVVTVTAHMRELTEDEKKASAERNVAMMASR
jgi:hypothetical protein